jgi:hypothetical protein
MSPEDFLMRLQNVRRTGPNRWIACCPAHDDRHPSLNVKIEPDGTKLVICRSGCDNHSIREAMGCEWSDFFPEKSTGVYDRKLPRAFTAAEVLSALETEVTIVALLASDVAAGKPVSKEDKDRCLLASQRILAAKEMDVGYRR